MEIKRIGEKIVVQHFGALIPTLVLNRWEEFKKVEEKYSLSSFLTPGKFTVIFDRNQENISQIIGDYTELVGIAIPNWAKFN